MVEPVTSKEFGHDYFRGCYVDYFRQNPPRKLRGYLRLLKRHAPSGNLLDIGCSYGLFVAEAQHHFHCSGMDLDAGVVAEAARRAPGAQFVTAILPWLPFRGLAGVTAFDVMEHTRDVEGAMVAIWDALRPGGVALVVVPVYDGPFGGLVHHLDRDPTHVHKRSRDFWVSLAAGHFEVVEWKGIFRGLLPWGAYISLHTRMLRRVAPAIVLVLRRRYEESGPCGPGA